ncbi:hypothetical protein R1T08_18570 [Streptomyces sp. SBC-4]|nr:hypothetical protein [Streptomyces sp. SBC-4]MDV5146149.1 hypothetical protein [Streptomyces sp. SBC-4]
MNDPNPVLVSLALVWALTGVCCVVAAIVVSVRRNRASERNEEPSRGWHPFRRPYPEAAGIAALAHLAVAWPLGHQSAGSTAFSALSAAMVGSAVSYLLTGRPRARPVPAGCLVAACGAALFGSLPT